MEPDREILEQFKTLARKTSRRNWADIYHEMVAEFLWGVRKGLTEGEARVKAMVHGRCWARDERSFENRRLPKPRQVVTSTEESEQAGRPSDGTDVQRQGIAEVQPGGPRGE